MLFCFFCDSPSPAGRKLVHQAARRGCRVGRGVVLGAGAPRAQGLLRARVSQHPVGEAPEPRPVALWKAGERKEVYRDGGWESAGACSHFVISTLVVVKQQQGASVEHIHLHDTLSRQRARSVFP